MHNFILFGTVGDCSLFAQWEKGNEEELFLPTKCKDLVIQKPEPGFTEISAKPVVLF